MPGYEERTKRHDTFLFMIGAKQARFAQLEDRFFLPERKVELLMGEYEEFIGVIENRHWKKLTTPKPTFNELIVREFYANSYLVKRSDEKGRSSWVKGTQINYDRDTLREFF